MDRKPQPVSEEVRFTCKTVVRTIRIKRKRKVNFLQIHFLRRKRWIVQISFATRFVWKARLISQIKSLYVSYRLFMMKLSVGLDLNFAMINAAPWVQTVKR